jgi:Spy/CpxP family protein refolding chaperone
MKKYYLVVAMAILALGVLAALPALAQDHGQPRPQTGEPAGGDGGAGPGMAHPMMGRHGMGLGAGPFWRNPMVAQHLALTQQQIDKLEELLTAHEREMISLESEMKLAHFDLQQVLEHNPPDEAAAKKAIENVLAAQRRIMWGQLSFHIAAMKILTKEQVDKLNQMRGGEMMQHGGRWPHHDFTPPAGDGPH